MHFIYHDGTVKDVDTLDQMYMKKPQKQPVRLAFDPGWQIEADIYKTNELYERDVSIRLVWSDTMTQIPWTWEILKNFFDNNNVAPKFIEGNYTDPYYDEESGEWTAGLIKTVRFKIINK